MKIVIKTVLVPPPPPTNEVIITMTPKEARDIHNKLYKLITNANMDKLSTEDLAPIWNLINELTKSSVQTIGQ